MTSPYFLVLVGFLAFFTIYQFWSTSLQAENLEASAFRGFLDISFAQTEKVPPVEKNNPVSFYDEKNIEKKLVFEAPTLEAEAAIVVDAKTGEVIFTKNAHTQFPLASITKVMAALIVEKTYKNGEVLTLGKEPLQVDGGDALLPSQQWKFRDLLNFSLVTSSNDGVSALSYKAFPEEGNERFIEKMNDKAQELGLSQTFYLNPTGLDSSETISGGYSSALDVASLFRYVERKYPKLLDATTQKEIVVSTVSGKIIRGGNTNKIVQQIPSLLASKTGYTDLAGGNLAIMYNAGLDHSIVIVVLHSTQEGRFRDVKNLIEATTNFLSGHSIKDS